MAGYTDKIREGVSPKGVVLEETQQTGKIEEHTCIEAANTALFQHQTKGLDG